MKVKNLGVNRETYDWLDENIEKCPIYCRNCGELLEVKPNYEIYKTIFPEINSDDKIELAKYRLADGRYVYEIVQNVYFKDDTMFVILALSKSESVDDILENTKWTQTEIDDEICFNLDMYNNTKW